MNACFGLGSAAAPLIASAAFKLLGNSIGAFAIIGLMSIFSGIVIFRIPCFIAAETAGSRCLLFCHTASGSVRW